MTDPHELLALAEAAATDGAAELLARFGRAIDVDTKSTATDPVSEADLASEAAIRRVLSAARPGDALLGEESGQSEVLVPGSAPTGLCWVVDPLDGTVNYLYGIAQFAVSVAVEDADGTVAGVVLEPVSGERFSGVRGGSLRWRRGGTADATELPAPAVGAAVALDRALVATGFAYDARVREHQGRVIAELLPRVRDVRRAGAAALDLCAAAAGRVDAYYERGVRPWDVAAGALFCELAGLVVRSLPAAPAREDGGVALPGGILVAPAAIVDALEALVTAEA